jgi:FkbM family methyltransferase
MRNLYKNIRKRTSLKRGHTSIKNKLTGYNNIKFCTRNELEFSKVAESDGEIEFLEMFLSVLSESDIVFDIGANMGLFTLYAYAAVKDIDIYRFEPVPEYYNRLLQNLALNNIHDVNTYNYGLGNENNSTTFMYKNVLGSGMGSGSERYSKKYTFDFKEQVCEIKKGDSLIKNSVLPVPAVIKIDVEGMEMNVLNGLAETLQHTKCQYVFCEIHTTLDPVLYGEVCRLCADCGFKTENIYAKKEGIGIIAYK